MPLHGEFIVNDAQFSLYSYTVLALFWLTRAMEYIVTKPVAWLFLTMAQSSGPLSHRQQANGRLEMNVENRSS